MINLVKGQTIDLRKNEGGGDNNLSKITLGLGWDISKSGKGNYDLDAVAILLDKNGKITNEKDIIYYGNLKHPTGKVWSNGDNLTGDGDGDDEQIVVMLDELDAKYEKIVFFTSIYQGHSRGQNFGCVENAFIRAVDGSNKEIAKFKISGDPSLSSKASFIFGEAYRHSGTWKFRALGEAKDTDSYSQICESYR